MNTILTQIQENIKSEIKIDSEGKAVVSIQGAARLAGIDVAALSRSFQSVVKKPTKLARFLMEYGFEGVVILDFNKNGVPDIALSLILNYYAHHAGAYCTEIAKMTLISFSTVGIRYWCQKTVGYEQPKKPRIVPTKRTK